MSESSTYEAFVRDVLGRLGRLQRQVDELQEKLDDVEIVAACVDERTGGTWAMDKYGPKRASKGKPVKGTANVFEFPRGGQP